MGKIGIVRHHRAQGRRQNLTWTLSLWCGIRRHRVQRRRQGTIESMKLYTPSSSLPKDFDHESIDVDRNVPPPTQERPTESRHSHSNSDCWLAISNAPSAESQF